MNDVVEMLKCNWKQEKRRTYMNFKVIWRIFSEKN